MDESKGQLGEDSLLHVARQIYERSRSGILQVEGADQRRLIFVGGELHVEADHPLALLLGEAGEKNGKSARELASVATHLSGLLDGVRAGEYRFLTDEIASESTRVLPTGAIVMGTLGDELPEKDLLSQLGGEGPRWQVVMDATSRRRISGLDADTSALLRRMERPMSIGDLLKELSGNRVDNLRTLYRLGQVKLIKKVDAARLRREGDSAVSRKLVNHFTKRVDKQLERKPLVIDSEAHRTRVANLLAVVGGLNHYELLNVDSAADTGEIHAAFDELSRLVHPRHARALQLEGRAAVLEMLFQRSVAAYVTLTDPDRRGHYDWQMEVDSAPRKSEKDLFAEKKVLARQKYRQAVNLAANEDYHFAVELLLQAVQLHSTVDVLTLLAEIEGRNPHWRERAVGRYREAIDLSPEDPKIRTALARLLADLDRIGEARVVVKETLEKFPVHPEAQDLLVLLDKEEPGKGIGRFFGFRKS